jgi:hypothetical protein
VHPAAAHARRFLAGKPASASLQAGRMDAGDSAWRKPLKNPCYVAPDADTQPKMNPTQKQFSLNRATSKGKFPSIFLTESVRN